MNFSSAKRLARLALLLELGWLCAPAFATDMAQLYQAALNHDAQYSAARAVAEAGREKLPQALAGLLPSLSAGANSAWNDSKTRVQISPEFQQRYNSNGYQLSLTQPLFRWQNFVQYGQGQWQVIAAEANFAEASQDLILRVAEAYFNVLYAAENLKAINANQAAIAQQLAQAKKNFEVGSATITDAQEAEARADLASAQAIAAASELDIRRYALRLIVGQEFGEINVLKPDAQLNGPQPAALNDWMLAADNSFKVQAQQANAEIAAKEVERQRAGHYPTLDAVANYAKNNSNTGFPLNNEFQATGGSVGVQLNIPIFQGGYVNSKTREAAANRNAATATLEGAKRAAILATQQSFLGVVNGLAQVNALNAALRSSLSALASNKLGYEVGVRINIDVLNAEQQVYVTRRDLAKARLDTLLAQLKLKAAVGALSEVDLNAINALLVPENSPES